MKFKKNDIEGIAKRLYRDLHGKEFVQIVSSENEFIKIVHDTIEKNMNEESAKPHGKVEENEE